MMLVDNDAIPAELVGPLNFIQVAVVEFMALDRVINRIGKGYPGRIVFFVKICWQVGPGHQVKVVKL